MSARTPRTNVGQQAFEQLDELLVRLRDQMDRSQDALREKVAELARTKDFGEVGRAVALLGEVATSVDEVRRKIDSARRPPRAAVSRTEAEGGRSIADFRRIVLETLADAPDESASPGALTRLVGERGEQEHWFTAADLKPLPSRPNVLRWRHYLSMAVTRCREDGQIERNQDGHWRLTEEGRRVLRQHASGSTS